MDGVRKAVLRLLQDGEVHPQLVALAVARVAGELGAGIAQAGDTVRKVSHLEQSNDFSDWDQISCDFP